MRTQTKYSLYIGALAALFFVPFLGGVHLFDWDEINFAEIAREMVVLEDYLRVYVDFEPFWEKPPFFFWLQAFSMEIFGIGEYGARFPNAVCGVITLVVLFNIGTRLYDYRFGALWALVYLGSILPHLYFKSGIIDPWFNLFIFLGLYFFILFYWKKDQFELYSLKKSTWYYLIVGGLWVGMGILTKGPVAYLIVCICLFVYWVYQRFHFYVSPLQFIVFSIGAIFIMLTWYGIETAAHGPWFVIEFTKYQFRLFNTPDAGHGGFPGYHFVVLLVGCFPASFFAIRAFFKQPVRLDYQQDFKVWMLILFWVVLILFSIVKSKIVHYSSMAYFPLTYLATLTLYQIIRKEIEVPRWLSVGLLSLGTLMSLVVMAVPFLGMNIYLLKPLLASNSFGQANLEADVHWTGLEAIAGLWLLGVTWLGIKWLKGQQALRGSLVLFGGTACFVFMTLIFFIKRIEKYSQGAAIEYLESLAGKDVYVDVYGYRSYAQLFYSQKPLYRNPEHIEQGAPSWEELMKSISNYTQPVRYSRPVSTQWLLNGDIDKDAYLLTRIHKADELRQREAWEEMGEKNGYVLFRRLATHP